MGKIENPDGIGKVGNPVCLADGEILHTNCILKSVRDLSVDDRVIGQSGFYSKIDRVFLRNYQGFVSIIKNRLGKTCITPEHLVLAKKVPLNKDRFKRIKGKQELPYGWYHACELKRGDVTLYPIFKEIKDRDYIDVDIKKNKFDYNSKSVGDKILLNFSFLRLCGYYLSEGSVKDITTKRYLAFTFNINEVDYMKDIIKIVKDLWSLKVYVQEIRKKNTVQVTLNNTFLVRFFKQHFGDCAEEKRIPDWLILLPPAKQKHLIYGLWKGDGYVNLNIPRAGYSTVSAQLFSQLKLLLLRQRIIPSLYSEEEKTVKGVKHKKSYRVNIGDRESLRNLFQILGIKYKFNSFLRKKVWIDENFVYLPITYIEKREYKGKVYNLEVEEEHSFATGSLCLHNCGDVMWIYIKVKDNVIVDCKFETFGCVAAIATSSILTDLVKGKTIDEALKVSNKDVASQLGGLPPIKMHCSLLAEEGIKAAIDDYLKKKR
jgi:nitrogen fixation NifU-like protein